MDIHNEEYQQIQTSRYANAKRLAEKRRSEAESLMNQASDMGKEIPLGQPILIGHHSEKRDRAYRGRIENKMRKASENYAKAKYHEQKAKTIQNNETIRQDDPEAVKLLKEKISELKKEHARVKALPKRPRDYSFSEIDMRSCHLSSLSTKIRAAEKRIQKIQELEAMPDIDEEINGVRIYTEDGRIRMYFGYIPSEQTRDKLKDSCFKWSRYNEVWQNYINQHNIDKAREIAKSEAVQ